MAERLRVLVVEDERVDRMAFERFVNQEGLPYDYKLASSLAEANKIVSQEEKRFDLVLVDYQWGMAPAWSC